jgi:hypothetical protein
MTQALPPSKTSPAFNRVAASLQVAETEQSGEKATVAASTAAMTQTPQEPTSAECTTGTCVMPQSAEVLTPQQELYLTLKGDLQLQGTQRGADGRITALGIAAQAPAQNHPKMPAI